MHWQHISPLFCFINPVEQSHCAFPGIQFEFTITTSHYIYYIACAGIYVPCYVFYICISACLLTNITKVVNCLKKIDHKNMV